jgi:hypothetical protein
MQRTASCPSPDEQKQVLRALRRATHQIAIDSINGDIDMGDKGSKDKSKREKQKKAMLTPKEQRKLRNEKKNRKPRESG